MTLDQLYAFVAVVREGTITAAAAALHKSQPAVSKLVSNLEADLGTALLDRSGYRPTLTDEGRVFFERAQSLTQDAGALLQLGENLSRNPERRVRVALDAITPLPPVLDILVRVRRQFPSVRIELDVGRWTGASAALVDGKADLAVAGGSLPDSPRVVARPFPSVTVVAVARADHPVALAPLPVADAVLREHPQVVLADPTGAGSSTSLNVLRDGLSWRVTDLWAKKQIIEAGLGWGGLPAHLVAGELASGTLKQLDVPAFEAHSMTLHVLRRRSRAKRVVTGMLWADLCRLATL
ncbi:MAG: LysR family transcriptional regulator [Nannocystales bacterium]